ncbi:MAG TPA: gamma-glutamylcyclotransferase [Verrucomicrobiales bacterium]|nr:gamma-glutamylcyclotransferase [Verrucomicrobiales bacterium]
MLYFAYGSNLLEERLKLHVPDARFVAVGRLPGWRRMFHLRSQDGSAKCDLVRCPDESSPIEGALYECSAKGREALDVWEGLGSMYRLEEVRIESELGEQMAFFYAGSESFVDPERRPYDWYLASIVAGARRHRLTEETLASLSSVPSWNDPDSERSFRNWKLIPANLR